VFLNNILNY